MARSLIILILVIFSVISCSKESAEHESSTSLIGEWNWIQSCGGLAGSCYTPQSTKQTIKIVFSSDSIYSSYLNDSLTISCKFSVKKVYSDNYNFSTIIVFANRPITDTYSIKHDTLFLDDSCCDLYSNIYKRIK